MQEFDKRNNFTDFNKKQEIYNNYRNAFLDYIRIKDRIDLIML